MMKSPSLAHARISCLIGTILLSTNTPFPSYELSLICYAMLIPSVNKSALNTPYVIILYAGQRKKS